MVIGRGGEGEREKQRWGGAKRKTRHQFEAMRFKPFAKRNSSIGTVVLMRAKTITVIQQRDRGDENNAI